jgi:hypothetical protein
MKPLHLHPNLIMSAAGGVRKAENIEVCCFHYLRQSRVPSQPAFVSDRLSLPIAV